MLITLLQVLIISFIWGLIAAWLVYRASYSHEEEPGKIALKQFFLGFLLLPVSVIVVIFTLKKYQRLNSSN